MMDALLPATDVGDELFANPRLWHLYFHAVRDMAEMLLAGREREYLTIGGGASNSGPMLAKTALEVAENVRSELIPESGHFIPEESPDRLTELLLDFLKG